MWDCRGQFRSGALELAIDNLNPDSVLDILLQSEFASTSIYAILMKCDQYREIQGKFKFLDRASGKWNASYR